MLLTLSPQVKALMWINELINLLTYKLLEYLIDSIEYCYRSIVANVQVVVQFLNIGTHSPLFHCLGQ